MQTNRKEGILVLNTKKPYTMSVNGKFENRNKIICKEITSNEEYIAYDIEHMIDTALFDLNEDYGKEKRPNSLPKEEEKKIDFNEFGKKISPSEKELEEVANAIEIIFRFNKSVFMSRLMQTFEGLVNSGLFRVDGNNLLTQTIWKTIHRNDKVRILFHYIAFFLNPFERLSNMAPSTKNQNESEATKDKELQFE